MAIDYAHNPISKIGLVEHVGLGDRQEDVNHIFPRFDRLDSASKFRSVDKGRKETILSTGNPYWLGVDFSNKSGIGFREAYREMMEFRLENYLLPAHEAYLRAFNLAKKKGA